MNPDTHTGMTHDTYIVLLPSLGTVRPRCRCGWAGDECALVDFDTAAAQETGHIADVLYELIYGPDDGSEEEQGDD